MTPPMTDEQLQQAEELASIRGPHAGSGCCCNQCLQAAVLPVLRDEVLHLRSRLAAAERQPASHYQCCACGQRMKTWRDMEEFQHADCGGVVELRKVIETRAERDAARAKLEALAEQYTAQEQELRTAKAKLAAVNAGYGNVWFWQGDDQDNPLSLSCPVVMSADTLRAMTAKLASVEAERDALKRDGRALVKQFENISRALNDIGWPSQNAMATDRACDALRVLSGSVATLTAQRDQAVGERDAVQRDFDALVRMDKAGELLAAVQQDIRGQVERETVEAIAAWLDDEAACGSGYGKDFAADIRNGAYRKGP